VSTGAAVGIGLLFFVGIGMAVGSAIHHDDYYPYPAWGGGGLLWWASLTMRRRIGPVYAGYRPAYGYNPPATTAGTSTTATPNIAVNNNYYGRFKNTNVNTRLGLETIGIWQTTMARSRQSRRNGKDKSNLSRIS